MSKIKIIYVNEIENPPPSKEYKVVKGDSLWAIARNNYGKGKIYFMGLPVEQALSGIPGVFHKTDALPWHSLYKIFAYKFISSRAAIKSNPQIGITEHAENENSRYVVLINYGSKKAESGLKINDGWILTSVIHGEKNKEIARLEIPGNSAVVLSLKVH